MKEELRELYEEYGVALDQEYGHRENYSRLDYASIAGFWHWLITGFLTLQ